MIAELDRYQGVVLRQLLVALGRRVSLGIANLTGRVDAFSIDGAAFQVKHSSKRLSPWQFTYLPENLDEVGELQRSYDPVWVILVCGQDGLVCLSLDELRSILQIGQGGAGWIRVSRDRNAMYRVRGTLGTLPRAKPKGLEPFLVHAFGPGSVRTE